MYEESIKERQMKNKRFGAGIALLAAGVAIMASSSIAAGIALMAVGIGILVIRARKTR